MFISDQTPSLSICFAQEILKGVYQADETDKRGKHKSEEKVFERAMYLEIHKQT